MTERQRRMSVPEFGGTGMLHQQRVKIALDGGCGMRPRAKPVEAERLEAACVEFIHAMNEYRRAKKASAGTFASFEARGLTVVVAWGSSSKPDLREWVTARRGKPQSAEKAIRRRAAKEAADA